jgi:hypothetical protein
MSSSDGITWSTRQHPSETLSGICWSPELNLFVSVATGTPSTTNVIYSTFNFSGLNTTYNIGTASTSNLTIEGHDVLVGSKAAVLDIGRYADQIYIGGVNFNLIKNYVVVAAINVTAAGVINFSYNVDSVTVATNVYTINLSKDLTNTNYYVVANVTTSNNAGLAYNTARTVSSFTITTRLGNGNTALPFTAIVFLNGFMPYL